MGRKLFGTDGIRGVAGQPPLDEATVFAAGLALGRWALAGGQASAQILLGMDTRESSPLLASQLAGGLEQAGVQVRFAGVITTPGVAYLTRSRDFVAGVMISASHNPYQDNGIKIFDHSGFKLPDEVEQALEGEIFALLQAGLHPRRAQLEPDEGLDEAYLRYLLGTFSERMNGMRIVVDCANGAACRLAPELFRRLGAEVTAIACEPDGRNINRDCGALHLEGLRREVPARGAAAGVAFDGDADRALFVSHSGRIVDGDAVLLVSARRMLETGALAAEGASPAVVATVMSNYGLEAALAKLGVRLLRTAVGDKYVLEEMVRAGVRLGGEQSGHIIYRQYATTGDGLLTALRVFEVMRQTGKNLDELTAELKIFPQTLINVRVREKRPLEEIPSVQKEIQAAVADFAGAGRVLVRFSGTEPLARIMVEGPEQSRVDAFARRIAQAVEREIGEAAVPVTS